MLIKGNFVDLEQRNVYPCEILIEEGVIKRIQEIDEYVDSYIMPGFIDSHVHIESSMLVPSEFAREAVRHGTVAVVSDPHEIANVMGVKGIDFMIENGKEVPLKFYFGAPSCVPATNLERSGAVIDATMIEDLLARDDIFYLGELMNFPGVIHGDKEVYEKLNSARKHNKPVDGHVPGIRGDDLQEYINSGISTDHEAFSYDEAVDKIERGMKILIREGSAARNLDALAPLFNTFPEKLMLCSDDIHPEMLMERHINGLVKRLVKDGYDIYDVLRAASVNVVEHYGIDVGLLNIADPADFIVVRDLEDFEILETWIQGDRTFGKNRLSFSTKLTDTPNEFNATELDSLSIKVRNKQRPVRVIDVSDGELYTKVLVLGWSSDEYLNPDLDKDILKLVVKDRYQDGPPAVAFIRGIGIKEGAMASSVAHDSHNIIAAGVDDSSIINAINEVIRKKGGLAVCSSGKTESLSLPVGGIMSNVPCGTIAQHYLKLSERVKDMGSHLKAPFMTLSFMSLLVIPELKLGDAGLFDGLKFEFTDLFVD